VTARKARCAYDSCRRELIEYRHHLGETGILAIQSIAVHAYFISLRRKNTLKYPANTVTTTLQSPLGLIRLAANPMGLSGVWFEGQRHQTDASHWPTVANHPVMQEATTQLQQYFCGQRTRFELPIDLSTGTEFQQSVWHALLTIDCGKTCSYGALSAQIAKPGAVRAVSSAIGKNPLSIIVPCHRIIGVTGALTGYAGGLDRKAALLKLEGAL
jgi:methylated-DNA-[protein]-cysteine S-methyltransferase